MALYEELLEAMGAFGPYQIYMVIWFAINLLMFGSQMGFMAFGILAPNINVTDWQLSNNASSYDWSHESGFFSLASEFHLVGSRKFIAPLMISMQVVGMIIGAICAGVLSDRYGRKWTYLACLFVYAISSVASIYANSWEVYCIARAFIGFGLSSTTTVSHVWCLEKLVSRWRLIIMVGGWPLGFIFCAVLAMYVKNWKILTVSIVGPWPMAVLGWIFIQESPKWLIESENLEDLGRVVKRICKWNGRRFTEIQNILKKLENFQTYTVKTTIKCTILDLFYSRRAAMTTLALGYSWFLTALVFYANLYNIGKLSGDPSMNMIYIMLMRTLVGSAIPFIDYLIPKLGRRHLMFIGLFFFGAAMLIVSVAQGIGSGKVSPLLTRVPCIVALSTASILWAMITILNIESFPTLLRTNGYAYTMITNRIGVLLGPQIILLSDFYAPLPYLIFLAGIVLNVVIVLFVIQETKNQPLPELPKKDIRITAADLLLENGMTMDESVITHL